MVIHNPVLMDSDKGDNNIATVDIIDTDDKSNIIKKELLNKFVNCKKLWIYAKGEGQCHFSLLSLLYQIQDTSIQQVEIERYAEGISESSKFIKVKELYKKKNWDINEKYGRITIQRHGISN